MIRMTEQAPKKNGHSTSTNQAAKMLGKNERTIRRWIDSGKMASSKPNGQRLIPLAEIERLRQEMPDLAPSDTELLTTMGAQLQEHDERLEKAEALIQQLLLLIKQLQSAGAGGGDQPRRRTHRGKGRYYDPALRGLPPGSLRLSEFVAEHQEGEQQMERNELEKLRARGEIGMTPHLMQGKSGRYEWWLTPEQQQQVLAHYQRQSETPGTGEAPALSD
jgi:excisionase family DNA binding protein